jgi:hypothetical protein
VVLQLVASRIVLSPIELVSPGKELRFPSQYKLRVCIGALGTVRSEKSAPGSLCRGWWERLAYRTRAAEPDLLFLSVI